MSLFSSNKIFSTSQQIKDALYQIKSLDYRQRPNVFEALVKDWMTAELLRKNH
jgi:hypothetical protein